MIHIYFKTPLHGHLFRYEILSSIKSLSRNFYNLTPVPAEMAIMPVLWSYFI